MDPESIFNLAWDHNLPVEDATYRPGVNAVDDHYQQQRYEQNEYQRFIRQRSRVPTLEDWGFAEYDIDLEHRYRGFGVPAAVIEPLEERPRALLHFSTIRNGGFRRYTTPPTTPELPAVRPQGHQIAPPHPDLLPNTLRYPDHIWYSAAFFAQTMWQDYQHRVTMHPLEESFICNKLSLLTEALIMAFRTEFPLTPWSDDHLRSLIAQARWQAKLYIFKEEELRILHTAAYRHESEESAWLSLRAEWLYYPKDREAVRRKYSQIQQEYAKSGV